MSNGLWCWRNHLLAGALSASATEPNLGVGNLQNDQGSASAAWQTLYGAVSGSFTLDVGAPRSFGAFGLFRTNLTPLAKVRWRAGGAGMLSGGAAEYDSGLVTPGVAAGYGQAITVPPAPVSAQVVQCEIQDLGNPDLFLNVPLAFAGEAVRFRRNWSYGSSFGRQEGADEVRSRAGAVYGTLRWAARQWDVAMNGIDRTEAWPLLMDLDRVARQRDNILFIPNPESATLQREAVFGIVRPSSNIAVANYPLRTWRATIEERL